MTTLNLRIGGMHCERCVSTVQSEVLKLDGVTAARVSVGAAAVDYDPARARVADIVTAVRSAGDFVVDSFEVSG